jgi:hypothetical protein
MESTGWRTGFSPLAFGRIRCNGSGRHQQFRSHCVPDGYASAKIGRFANIGARDSRQCKIFCGRKRRRGSNSNGDYFAVDGSNFYRFRSVRAQRGCHGSSVPAPCPEWTRAAAGKTNRSSAIQARLAPACSRPFVVQLVHS